MIKLIENVTFRELSLEVDSFNRQSKININIEFDYRDNSKDVVSGFTINWPSIGASNIDSTCEFIDQMKKAVDKANELTNKYVGAIITY